MPYLLALIEASMTKQLFYACTILLLAGITQAATQPTVRHNLSFNKLATRWDEAMPLGNGMLGALVWEKNKRLRLSLDRADLWDDRKALDLTGYTFKWVEAQVLKKDYQPVQNALDAPYDQSPYPTKLPAAAIEFDISPLGKVVSNILDIKTAINTVRFENGTIFSCYVHASEQRGYFRFEHLPAGIDPALVMHNYSGNIKATNDNSHAGEGLQKLGYSTGTLTQGNQSILYHQPTAQGKYYEVLVKWQSGKGGALHGTWTITNTQQAVIAPAAIANLYNTDQTSHINWWKQFWKQSSVALPDSLLEKQYYLELYKLGCVARPGAPAITLQAVWTADNGSLPPWKGDFHNDLNTQLSYWPAYTANHLSESASFTDWLWKIKAGNEQFTKQYFEIAGLNVPGVATISGAPMGGWIQYALSPTVSAWLSQHFYWQWKYSMDPQFLANKAYPYLHAAASFLENITRLENGVRMLPLSSSPEYHDNDIRAWFRQWSNYDLSLAKFLFKAAAEVSKAHGKTAESQHWQQVLNELPAFEVNETGFTLAPGENLEASHRHMSQYMAIYPLALLDINRPADRTVIENSLKRIEAMGTRAWCGYSFSWMACLYARAYEADKAVQQLQIFASNFCSPNSFHLNGDQKGGQYSGFTYRPFTLEGNFAFAQGVQELLLQSREGYVEVFPAVPKSWQEVSFTDLRAEGAFLVSARKEKGVPVYVKVTATRDGLLNIRLPFKKYRIQSKVIIPGATEGVDTLPLHLRQGQVVEFEAY